MSKKDAIGISIGTKIKEISIKSKKNPKRKISSILVKIKTNFPASRSVNVLLKRESPPSPLKTNEKAVAPIKIMKTILVRVAVYLAASKNFLNSNRFLISDNIIAPKQPSAPDSVGEAIPKIIDPSTIVISASEGIIEMRALRIFGFSSKPPIFSKSLGDINLALITI